MSSPRASFLPASLPAAALALAALGLGPARPAVAQDRTDATTTAAREPGTLPDLRAALRTLVEDPALRGGRVGVHVVALRGPGAAPRELLAHRADSGFMTASNMKLVSSAVGLETLGPSFRFTTTLLATGPVHDGVVDGDLVLVGSGDPTLGGRDEPRPEAVFERMLEAARTQLAAAGGLRRVTGDVLGDDDCMPDEVMGEGWAWNYQGASYAAQVSGLCFAENCVSLTARPGDAPGDPVRAVLQPPTDYLALTDSGARTVAATEQDGTPAKTRLVLDRERLNNRLVLRGTMPVGAEPRSLRASVENPTAYAARVLLETLRGAGVEVAGTSMDRDDALPRPERYGDERVLARHRSAPLADVLRRLNKISQNLYAEQLIRTAALRATGNGSMRSAAAHARAVLAELGVDTDGLAVADGSGLTRLNLVRPRQFTALLAGMRASPHADLFLDTLPVAGVDGTLRSRFGEGDARGRVRAKTGYIRRVVALSGYVLEEDEESKPKLAFSVLVNDFTCPTADAKRAVDRFVEALAASVASPVR